MTPERAAVLERKREAADKLSAEIKAAREQKLRLDAAKTERLREQRLAKEAAEADAANNGSSAANGSPPTKAVRKSPRPTKPSRLKATS